MSDAPCILVLAYDRWIGVWQTECTLVMEDRCIARVAAPVPD